MSDHDLFGYRDTIHEAAAAHNRAASKRAKDASQTRSVHDLEDRIERLSLVCMAMWSLLQDRAKLTEDDLLERVRTLDLMDGVPDGKATRGVAKCGRCHRTMSNRHRRCLYCGHEKLAESAFDAI